MSSERETDEQRARQLSDALTDAISFGTPLKLPQWATVSRTPGQRRLFACLWDTKRQAEENCGPDEVLVKVRVQIEAVYR